MQQQQNNGADTEPGLAALVLIAQFHGLAAYAAQLRHQSGLASQTFAPADRPTEPGATATDAEHAGRNQGQPAPATPQADRPDRRDGAAIERAYRRWRSAGRHLAGRSQCREQGIGFVNAGQTAAIKVQAFPYTRYGYLTGAVTQVSNDAAQDKKGQLTFPLTASLPTSRMHIENKWVNLTPGMAVTVEIRTGKRRVGEYFLSPLVAYASESLREMRIILST